LNYDAAKKDIFTEINSIHFHILISAVGTITILPNAEAH
jgi:hypothetical protein